MLLSSIALQLVQQEHVSPTQAYAWAWRIQNEYPPALQAAAERWAEGLPAEPATEAGEMSLEVIQQRSGATVPQALELLYVLHRDPVEGRQLLARCTRRDRLR